jgi:hypothetical protein
MRQDALRRGQAQGEARLLAQQFRHLRAVRMRRRLRAGDAFPLGDLVIRRQLADRVARQQCAFEDAGAAIDVFPGVTKGSFVHRMT